MTTLEQNEAYFLQRLDPYRIRHSKGNEYRSRCPMHGGNNQSAMAIDMEDGLYYCFSCQAKGKGPIQFEQHLSKAEGGIILPFVEAKMAVEGFIGTPFQKRVYLEPLGQAKKHGKWNRKYARDRYLYTDELGNEMFSVWRFEDTQGNKSTPPDAPCGCSPDAVCDRCGGERRVWSIEGVTRVLYRLPDILQALVVFVVEGEKNANDLSRALGVYLKKSKGIQIGALTVDRIAVTTNIGGANAWKSEHKYGRWFFRKIVIKLGDNDAAGRLHDESVCKDVSRYAKELFTLDLPVGEGEDISDFLDRNPVEALLKLLPNRVPWKVEEQKDPIIHGDLAPRQILVKPSQLLRSENEGGDWLVDRLVPRHGRGLVIAPPKTGKSFFFLDLALALGTVGSVLGIRPHGQPVRVAIVSREDGPVLVSERLRALAEGRGIPWSVVDANIRVNTRDQSERFRIDNDADLEEMAQWLKAERIEFTVIDVLNKLHGGEENSSDQMTKVMSRFDELSRLSGSDVCVIHHTNKGGGARGSSSIEGWADYIFRLEADVVDEALKTLHVRTKASGNVAPRQMRYMQSDDMKSSRIMMVVPR
jgi:hypothetical protein